MTSELSGFYRLGLKARRAEIAEIAELTEEELLVLSGELGLRDAHADRMVENALGVLGLPLGIIVGRLAWRLVADGLGVSTTATVPWAAVLLCVPVFIVAVNLVAFLPARAAARMRPPCVATIAVSMAGRLGAPVSACQSPPRGQLGESRTVHQARLVIIPSRPVGRPPPPPGAALPPVPKV